VVREGVRLIKEADRGEPETQTTESSQTTQTTECGSPSVKTVNIAEMLLRRAMIGALSHAGITADAFEAIPPGGHRRAIVDDITVLVLPL